MIFFYKLLDVLFFSFLKFQRGLQITKNRPKIEGKEKIGIRRLFFWKGIQADFYPNGKKILGYTEFAEPGFLLLLVKQENKSTFIWLIGKLEICMNQAFIFINSKLLGSLLYYCFCLLGR